MQLHTLLSHAMAWPAWYAWHTTACCIKGLRLIESVEAHLKEAHCLSWVQPAHTVAEPSGLCTCHSKHCSWHV